MQGTIAGLRAAASREDLEERPLDDRRMALQEAYHVPD